MCTITFLPTGPDSFILASNRDEQKIRPESTEPQQHVVNETRCLWPVDRQAGGTWIATNEFGVAFALMNDYQSQFVPSHDLISRGNIIPEIADCSSPRQVSNRFKHSKSLHKLSFQPFRLLMAKAGNGVRMWHFDGQTLHEGYQGNGAGIWVSAGKEEARILKGRQKLFEDYLKRSYAKNINRIMDLHTTQNGLTFTDYTDADTPALFGFSMELKKVQTVSATVIECPESEAGSVERGKSNSVRMHFMPGRPSPQKKWQTRELVQSTNLPDNDRHS